MAKPVLCTIAQVLVAYDPLGPVLALPQHVSWVWQQVSVGSIGGGAPRLPFTAVTSVLPK